MYLSAALEAMPAGGVDLGFVGMLGRNEIRKQQWSQGFREHCPIRNRTLKRTLRGAWQLGREDMGE